MEIERIKLKGDCVKDIDKLELLVPLTKDYFVTFLDSQWLVPTFKAMKRTVKMLPPPIVMRNGVHVEAKTCIDTYKVLMKQGWNACGP